ncbi:MAG: hypothetical protein K9N46_03360 [Candidatus Marinimicrobia bacterium]|nr:hypothetical protein [Candidatus Neomarinimicrobiota bacterium]MCF7828064.1 hypothetical protein [Candidatus Neomarinimicrobiota bacterium]MCF7879761.1 hypothetical protein [Candidatus Neomarinimicrobiota bacterium]
MLKLLKFLIVPYLVLFLTRPCVGNDDYTFGIKAGPTISRMAMLDGYKWAKHEHRYPLGMSIVGTVETPISHIFHWGGAFGYYFSNQKIQITEIDKINNSYTFHFLSGSIYTRVANLLPLKFAFLGGVGIDYLVQAKGELFNASYGALLVQDEITDEFPRFNPTIWFGIRKPFKVKFGQLYFELTGQLGLRRYNHNNLRWNNVGLSLLTGVQF